MPYDSPPPQRAETVVKSFQELWRSLFTSRVHLDSALSKQPRHLKSILAPIIQAVMLRPASYAEAMGVGVGPGEPWGLSQEQLADWRPPAILAGRMYEGMAQGLAEVGGSRHDFPAAFVDEWEADYGATRADELAAILSEEPPLSLRAIRELGAQALLDAIKPGVPVKTELSRIAPLGVRLAGYAAVLGHPYFEEGGFEIQDEGSQLMSLFALWPELYAQLLSQEPGAVRELKAPPPIPKDPPAWTVVDACAGAGGKTLALGDALAGRGRLYSYDVSETKLQALRRRASRAGLRSVQGVAVEEGSESKVVGRFRRRANAVLVDAPCSGWGVLRRNPDIKWRRDPDSLARMPTIQLRLLEAYSELVAPEGRLTFGVCTFRKAETIEVVKAFASAHPEFEAREGGYLGPGPCDGFFMQSFVRLKKG